MTIKQIEYFLAFAACGNLTIAAEKCLTVQPNLSRQIDKLESEVGRKLYLRAGGKMELTEAGRILVEHGRKLMDCYDALNASLADNNGAADITFGYVNCNTTLNELMDYVGESFLGYRINWVHGSSSALFDSGIVDMCFTFDPLDPSTERYSKLFDVPVTAIVPRTLMPACNRLEPSVFNTFPVMLPHGSIANEYLAFFRKEGLNVDIVHFPSVVFDIGSYLHRIKREKRIGFLPLYDSDMYSDNFFCASVTGLDFCVPLGIRWCKQKEEDCRKIANKIVSHYMKNFASPHK